MTATPIKALIIRPDLSHAVDVIAQDAQTLRSLVGGHMGALHTDVATILFNEDGDRLGLPLNRMATYLWWKLCPQFEGVDSLRGCVVFAGVPERDLLTEVNPDLIRLYDEMVLIRRSEERQRS